MNRRLLLWQFSALLTTTFATAENGESPAGPSRLREGSLWQDRAGRFQPSGERMFFYPSDKSPESIRVLPNLALERVANTLVEDDSNRWLISGSITEYRSANYLLLTKAVQQGPRTE